MIIFYHDDLDGRASAQVILHSLEHKAPHTTLFPMNYGNKPPPISLYSSKFVPKEDIYIVDFSLSEEYMCQLINAGYNVHWIDHHVSAIKRLARFSHLPGIRNTNQAACVLTWQYFNTLSKPPFPILLIEDYDIWKWEYKEHTAYFYFGAQLYDTIPRYNNYFWKDAFNSEEPYKSFFLTRIQKEGRIICDYRQNFYKDLRKQIGFECEFEEYKCFAMNVAKTGSQAVGTSLTGEYLDGSYDILIAYYHNGEDFCISLYSNKVDVSKIAEKYNGGGHVGAAGFTVKTLPFTRRTDETNKTEIL